MTSLRLKLVDLTSFDLVLSCANPNDLVKTNKKSVTLRERAGKNDDLVVPIPGPQDKSLFDFGLSNYIKQLDIQ